MQFNQRITAWFHTYKKRAVIIIATIGIITALLQLQSWYYYNYTLKGDVVLTIINDKFNQKHKGQRLQMTLPKCAYLERSTKISTSIHFGAHFKRDDQLIKMQCYEYPYPPYSAAIHVYGGAYDEHSLENVYGLFSCEKKFQPIDPKIGYRACKFPNSEIIYRYIFIGYDGQLVSFQPSLREKDEINQYWTHIQRNLDDGFQLEINIWQPYYQLTDIEEIKKLDQHLHQYFMSVSKRVDIMPLSAQPNPPNQNIK